MAKRSEFVSWRGSKDALKEHLQACKRHPPKPKRKKSRGKKRARLGEISREAIAELHGKAKRYCVDKGCGPGTEAYSILAGLGSYMGNYPRVRRATFDRLRSRLERLLAGGVEVLSVSSEAQAWPFEPPY